MPNKETLNTDILDAIRNSIVRGKDLLNEGFPISLDEITVKQTNCYAYSLGIMFNCFTKIRGFYSPGFTEHDNYKPEDSSEVLLNKIRRDLKNLHINYRDILVKGNAKLQDNEYLVKVYMANPNEKLPNGDFHLIRQDRASGKWFHKLGWFRQPDIFQCDPGFEDESGTPGEASDIITSVYDDKFRCIYHTVGYLAIEEH